MPQPSANVVIHVVQCDSEFTRSRSGLLCQLDGGVPRCARFFDRTTAFQVGDGRANIELTRGGVPAWRWQAGRLVAHRAPGGYTHPQFAVLEGKTLAEAIDALPAVRKALGEALGHAPPQRWGPSDRDGGLSR